jgi:hypothetical protein
LKHKIFKTIPWQMPGFVFPLHRAYSLASGLKPGAREITLLNSKGHIFAGHLFTDNTAS